MPGGAWDHPGEVMMERSQLRLLALAIRTNNGAVNEVRGAVSF